LTTALKTLLQKHGLRLDVPCCSVPIAPDVQKTADLSFIFNSVPYVVEIKTKLEFNSLGAAVLEAMAFKRQHSATHFILIGLYAFDAATFHARTVLENCGASPLIDSLVILSRNQDVKERTWNSHFAKAVNELISGLPVPRA
jgi:hypothetical protein